MPVCGAIGITTGAGAGAKVEMGTGAGIMAGVDGGGVKFVTALVGSGVTVVERGGKPGTECSGPLYSDGGAGKELGSGKEATEAVG